MIPRINRIERYRPVSRIDPVYPLYPFREEPAPPEQPLHVPSAPMRDGRPAAWEGPLRSAAKAAFTVVRQAIEVREAAERVALAATNEAMLDLQAKAERFRQRLAKGRELRLDAELPARLDKALTPADWRAIAAPFAAEAPEHLLPMLAGIYTADRGYRPLQDASGMIVAERV
ncbi:hypothetical protein [Cohnella sp. REN36]|uniref:hypothetical protein n=1 Tax=Cohnella sp. REN36 TaxID=2887347 RepID=UPI001D15BFEA|nr:hypothetical protein [Cohnella sp. REN36]MCC3377034.1 hypothetical protein [Cohnella sp. REN36]